VITYGGLTPDISSFLVESALYFRLTEPAGGIALADGDILKWNDADQKFKPDSIATYLSKADLKSVAAASTDFADFQSRIAAL